MQQNQSVNETNIPIFSILYKNLVLIIMSTVLFALVGLGYCVWKVPTQYVASRSVILRTTMEDSSSSSLSNQAALAKIYLPNVAKLIKSPDVIKEVNDVYNNGSETVSRNAIGVVYGEKSLIFTITYTDKTPELAEEKLNKLIEVFSGSEKFIQSVQAKEAKLIHTQKKCSIEEKTSYAKFVVVGGLAGAGLSIIVALLAYVLDNTIKSKEELEGIVGSSLLACVDKIKPNKNS